MVEKKNGENDSEKMNRSLNVIMVSSVLTLMFAFLSGCTSMGIGSISLETLKEKYEVEDSDFMTVQGLDIHYKDEGQGPSLVLFHGICASLYTWDGWANALKDKYRIIRMDLPGWGLTGPAGDDATNLDRMLEIMEEFLRRLGVDSCYLAGNSLGGYFAWNYALRHPEQINKVVLLDPVCYPQDPPWFIQVSGYPLLGILPRYMMPRWMITMNVRAVYGDPSRIEPEMYDLYFDLAMRKGNKNAYIDSFRYMARTCHNESLSEGVSQIQVPVLLMYGAKDKWVPPEQSDLWKRDLPGVECIVYDGAGHVPMEELPIETATDADRFFQRS
jgi:pimeloyl-ACP methyl ester carboxylesterase